MKTWPLTALLFPLLAITVSIATCAAAEPLQWKLSAGQNINLHYEQTTTTLTTAAKKTKKTTSQLSVWVNWTVSAASPNELPEGLKELPAGAVAIAQKLQRVRVQATTDGNEVSYDTSLRSLPTGPAKEYAASIAPLMKPDAIQKFILTPQGALLPLKAAATTDAGNPSVAEMLLRSPALLPATSDQKTWKEKKSLTTAIGQATHTLTYQLPEGSESSEGPIAIELKGELVIAPESVKAKSSEIVKFSQSGKLRFSAQEGRLVDSEQQTELVTETPLREDKIRVEVKSQLSLKLSAGTDPAQ